ncbi:unnamed protein product, partial [Menidia menidia]
MSMMKCNVSTVIVHLDFSEAWKCKDSSEVQSCHFGQNLPQLNPHTAMYYTKYPKTGFCTVSESKLQDAVPLTLGFKRTTWNLLLTSHGKGTLDSIGGTVKRTADNLILRGDDIVNLNISHEMVGSISCSTKLYIITEANMQPYDALLSQPLKPVPATRKLHQVTPTYRNNSEIH